MRIVSGLLLLSFLSLQAGCGSKSSTSETTASSGPTNPKTEPKVLQAAELTRALMDNEKALHDKYGGSGLAGERIQVRGKVVTVEVRDNTNPVLHLAGHNESEKDPVQIKCIFPDSEGEKLKELIPLAVVTIEGEFSKASSLALDRRITLIQCRVVK